MYDEFGIWTEYIDPYDPNYNNTTGQIDGREPSGVINNVVPPKPEVQTPPNRNIITALFGLANKLKEEQKKKDEQEDSQTKKSATTATTAATPTNSNAVAIPWYVWAGAGVVVLGAVVWAIVANRKIKKP